MDAVKATLSDKVRQSIQNDILSGYYRAGMRLPAEPALAKRFGVSRTIIREVIAGLKANGVLESRQGAGIFVLDREPEDQRLALFESDFVSLSDILEVMELRMAVEIEAAGLAAVRRTTAQLMKLLEVLHAMRKSIDAKLSSDVNDYEFHRAIAIATSNERYVDFFNFFRGTVIPRSRLYQSKVAPEKERAYYQQIYEQHQRIYTAIGNKQEQEARNAMRSHLVASVSFYRSLFMQIVARHDNKEGKE